MPRSLSINPSGSHSFFYLPTSPQSSPLPTHPLTHSPLTSLIHFKSIILSNLFRVHIHYTLYAKHLTTTKPKCLLSFKIALLAFATVAIAIPSSPNADEGAVFGAVESDLSMDCSGYPRSSDGTKPGMVATSAACGYPICYLYLTNPMK